MQFSTNWKHENAFPHWAWIFSSGSHWFLWMFTSVMTKFLDVALTKMKKKLLYKKFVSVEVLFESRLYERPLAIFFLPFWSTPRWLSLSRCLHRRRARESSHRKFEKLTGKKKKQHSVICAWYKKKKKCFKYFKDWCLPLKILAAILKVQYITSFTSFLSFFLKHNK